jgi:hypothetical protein
MLQHVNSEQISAWFSRQEAGKGAKERRRQNELQSEEQRLAKIQLETLRRYRLKELLNKEYQSSVELSF